MAEDRLVRRADGVPRAIVGGDLSPAFYLLAAVPLIAALTVHSVGIETKGQVLEKLEA